MAFVPAAEAERAVEILRRYPVTAGASVIGAVTETPAGVVTLRSVIGSNRIVDMLSGEQLPRIF